MKIQSSISSETDNYLKLKDVPAAFRLTVVYSSLNVVLSRQWAETCKSAPV
jgi:hypothetical protein